MIKGKLATLLLFIYGAGLLIGAVVHSLFVPWLLAGCLFAVNYAVSLLFFQAMTRLKPAAAAGLGVVSFVVRFGLLGLGLFLAGVFFKEYFLATAICFLVVYTVLLVVEIVVRAKGKTVDHSTVMGGKA